MTTKSEGIYYCRSAEVPKLGVKVALNVAEFYFHSAPPAEGFDVCAGFCLKKPIPAWRAYPQSTRIIDLASPLDMLFKSCSKNNRYKIERARRSDNVTTQFAVDPASIRLAEFCDYYNTFAATKGVPSIHRAQLDAMAQAERLVISAALDEEGKVLAAHAYYVERRRARLTHSASLFRRLADSTERNRIGRVNRLLHWNDIVRFHELGVSAYDMGGWYTGNRNDALLRINTFKSEFGGGVVDEWNVSRAGSIRGRLYLGARDTLQGVGRNRRG